MNCNKKTRINVNIILLAGIPVVFTLPIAGSDSGKSPKVLVPKAETSSSDVHDSGHEHHHIKDKDKKNTSDNQNSSITTQHEDESDHDTHQHASDPHSHAAALEGDKAASSETVSGESTFELSEIAASTLGITYKEIGPLKDAIYIVPNQAIVRYQDKMGIYAKRDKFYSLLTVSSLKPIGKDFAVKVPDGRGVEKIVVSGVALLRVAHLQASGQGGEGHVH